MTGFDLKGEVALVTGASRGIGAAVARRLAAAGATVLLNYKSNREAAERVLAEIKKDSPQSEILGFDVASAEETDRAISEVSKRFENISILVCNAGISRDNLLPRLNTNEFMEVFQTNLMGSVNTVKAVTRGMMRARKGRIVLMSSVVGETGNKGQSAYAASKSALFGFAKSVALEFGSRNITCNLICPGFIETEMTDALGEDVRKAYVEKIPLGRLGSADDIAAAVHYLVSPAGSYITGATIDVNGGLVMR